MTTTINNLYTTTSTQTIINFDDFIAYMQNDTSAPLRKIHKPEEKKVVKIFKMVKKEGTGGA